MGLRQTSGSVVCPRCGRLVGVRDARCFNCGRSHPGLFGFAPLLGRWGNNASFANLVLWGCGTMFLISLVLRPEGLLDGGILSMLGPDSKVLFLLGSSGGIPIFGQGRFWTVLSAAWLHGGIIHIIFNLMNIRPLVGAVENIFGVGRTIIIYTLSSVIGFATTSTIYYLAATGPLSFLPSFLSGAPLTVGASASICGMLGALLAYGRRSGQVHLERWAWNTIAAVVVMGFLLPFIDNWAHIGGFVGGYFVTKMLRPLEDESPLHILGGLICLVAMLAAIVLSVVHGLPIYNQWIAEAAG
jgi:rhomboid protease GluP